MTTTTKKITSLRDIRIEDVNMPPRLKGRLINYGIITLGDLLKKKTDLRSKIPQFGNVLQQQLEAVMLVIGYKPDDVTGKWVEMVRPDIQQASKRLIEISAEDAGLPVKETPQPDSLSDHRGLLDRLKQIQADVVNLLYIQLEEIDSKLYLSKYNGQVRIEVTEDELAGLYADIGKKLENR